MERDMDVLLENVVALERHFAGLEDAVLDLWVLLHRRGHFLGGNRAGACVAGGDREGG